MTFYQNISTAITTAKALAVTNGLKFIANENAGGQNGCCELKMTVLTMWICILDGYKCQNFDADGNPRTPDYECTTMAQALELIGKINTLSC